MLDGSHGTYEQAFMHPSFLRALWLLMIEGLKPPPLTETQKEDKVTCFFYLL